MEDCGERAGVGWRGGEGGDGVGKGAGEDEEGDGGGVFEVGRLSWFGGREGMGAGGGFLDPRRRCG